MPKDLQDIVEELEQPIHLLTALGYLKQQELSSLAVWYAIHDYICDWNAGKTTIPVYGIAGLRDAVNTFFHTHHPQHFQALPEPHPQLTKEPKEK